MSNFATSMADFGRCEPDTAAAVDFHTAVSLADTGCKFSPTCLDCPLPKCVDDLSSPQPPAILSAVAARLGVSREWLDTLIAETAAQRLPRKKIDQSWRWQKEVA